MADPNQEIEPEEVEKEETLIDHLIELRQRLIRAVLSVLLVFCGLFYFANEIYLFLSEPLRTLLPEGSTMIATGVTATFFTPFKLTMVLAIFLAIPIILHQIWSFISPGLYQNEKRIAIPLLIFSVILFYSGISFAYFVVFPLMLNFFTSIGPSEIVMMPDISQFLDIALKLFFAFGIAFQIPIATLLIVWSGITTAKDLAAKRPYVIVGCFVFGMLLTPPDIISQTLLAVPMWFLFEVGILMSRLVERKKDDDENVEANESLE